MFCDVGKATYRGLGGCAESSSHQLGVGLQKEFIRRRHQMSVKEINEDLTDSQLSCVTLGAASIKSFSSSGGTGAEARTSPVSRSR